MGWFFSIALGRKLLVWYDIVVHHVESSQARRMVSHHVPLLCYYVALHYLIRYVATVRRRAEPQAPKGGTGYSFILRRYIF